MKTSCQANIYLSPPSHTETSSLYYFWSNNVGYILKDPFWTNIKLNVDHNRWRMNSLNTVPQYSILLCLPYDTFCNNPIDRQIWISSVLMFPDFVHVSKTILMMKLSVELELYMICAYCNPCNPFTLIPLKANKFKLDNTTIVAKSFLHSFTL